MSTPSSTGRPRGRAPKGKVWCAQSKCWADESSPHVSAGPAAGGSAESPRRPTAETGSKRKAAGDESEDGPVASEIQNFESEDGPVASEIQNFETETQFLGFSPITLVDAGQYTPAWHPTAIHVHCMRRRDS